MDLDTFLRLPTREVADLVRAAGPRVCVFATNGTRRWFALAHGDADPATYPELASRRMVAQCRMLFEHGLDTLVMPILGPDILARGGAYQAMLERHLSALALDPIYTDLYRDLEVRVRFYGDYRSFFEGTPLVFALPHFARITEQTLPHGGRRLFFGLCAHDASEAVARFAVRHFQACGQAPGREQIVADYYGEPVGPVDLFIGAGPPAAFDMPLIATGREDLYFTVAPSPFLDVEGLRRILFDHLVARPGEPDPPDLTQADWRALAEFYDRNRQAVLGVGVRTRRGGYWLPEVRVERPASLAALLDGSDGGYAGPGGQERG